MLTFLLFLQILPVQPDTLHLEDLHRAAERNWPLYDQIERIDDVAALNVANLRTAWLPELSVSALAQYQSDVTTAPFSMPGVTPPSQPHDRYEASLNVQQLIWDGGVNARRIELEQLRHETDRHRLETELYRLKEQVNETFFTILLLQQRATSLDLLAEDLQARHDAVRARVAGGVMLPSQADILSVEMLKVRQSRIELDQLLGTAFDLLSVLTGLSLTGSKTLVLAAALPEGQRPEYALFDAQQAAIEASLRLNRASYAPRIAAFGQGAIGRPGLDLFSDSFNPYFIVGVQARWQLWNWNTGRREREVMQYQLRDVEDQRRTFDTRLEMDIIRQEALIDRLSAQLLLDDEIITLQESIAREAGSQLENGLITATEYVIALNAAHQARLQRRVRELELHQARITLQTIKGIQP